ncbi:helix-turn-helix domain-containing protein [Candidatus Paracaedibacter symbiosus]|uniref:helix-turn-helix domain-containing protein n=1 Tax=Candidatus Paracaedibacter symbiosus TaxID=244582 RepID=UPI0006923362|nr:helix-turn-helix transcriptional regulator [Candidatus Paracaedibacter symbiosus]
MPTKTSSIESLIGKKLKERRKQLGLPQHHVAKALGVTSQQIHKYENGLDRIPASRLLDLGQCLSVPITFFYDGLEKYEESGKEILVKCVNPKGKFILKMIGENYLNGVTHGQEIIVAPDSKQAKKWFIKAAEQDDNFRACWLLYKLCEKKLIPCEGPSENPSKRIRR